MKLPLPTATNCIQSNLVIEPTHSHEYFPGIQPAVEDFYCTCQKDNKGRCEVITNACHPNDMAICTLNPDGETCSCDCSFM